MAIFCHISACESVFPVEKLSLSCPRGLEASGKCQSLWDHNSQDCSRGKGWLSYFLENFGLSCMPKVMQGTKVDRYNARNM